MKKILLLTLALAALATSCRKKFEPIVVASDQISVFSSSDDKLMKSYEWAQKMAISYSHDNSDPVGYWYEAALPQREAFCMRDVSHQTIGGEILGLSKHNRNMMMRFAENISESKDWCTYWEINRHNKPAPVDYRNDKEFWYNLNANFDVIDACYRLYQWSGDSTYVKDPVFINFYEKSLNEYVERWDLQPDKIMSRPRFMNSPKPFNTKDSFHICRGLPSYVESFPGLTVTADLISTIYAGYAACAKIEAVRGEAQLSKKYADLAKQYKDLLNFRWWDPDKSAFYSFLTEKGEFHTGEGCTQTLWFGAVDNHDRITATLASLLGTDTNVENLSYFPALLYRYNYDRDAYELLLKLPYMKRSEYPEVSYGVTEGVVGGMMGIKPEFSENRITTTPRLLNHTEWAMIENVPVFGGYITVRHDAKTSTQFTNNINQTITWRAAYMGDAKIIEVNGKKQEVKTDTDQLGNTISYVDYQMAPGETAVCKVK